MGRSKWSRNEILEHEALRDACSFGGRSTMYVDAVDKQTSTKSQQRTAMTPICISLLLLLLSRHVESRFAVANNSEAHRLDAAKRGALVVHERSSTWSALSVVGGEAKKYMSARKMETLQ